VCGSNRSFSFKLQTAKQLGAGLLDFVSPNKYWAFAQFYSEIVKSGVKTPFYARFWAPSGRNHYFEAIKFA
jgi:hypothetical protein